MAHGFCLLPFLQSNIKHQKSTFPSWLMASAFSSIKHQTSNIKHQTSNINNQNSIPLSPITDNFSSSNQTSKINISLMAHGFARLCSRSRAKPRDLPFAFLSIKHQQ